MALASGWIPDLRYSRTARQWKTYVVEGGMLSRIACPKYGFPQLFFDKVCISDVRYLRTACQRKTYVVEGGVLFMLQKNQIGILSRRYFTLQ